MSLKALSGYYGTKVVDDSSNTGLPLSQTGPTSLSLNILLAEDEAAHAARVEKTLLCLGHVVAHKTCDGQEACQLCQDLKPDLVLMDQTLPKMDGLQAAFVINRNQPMPVVLMASQAKPGLVDEAQKAGVYACLFKPVEQNLLAQSIEVAFRQFQRVRGLECQVDDLRREISTRKLMGRASGILMKRLGIGEEQAILRMHEEAKAKAIAPSEVAQGIITAEKIAHCKC